MQEIENERMPEGIALGDLLAEDMPLFEAVTDPSLNTVVIIDERGHILAVNRSVTKNFGFSQEELLGRNVSVLMPDAYGKAHDGYLARYRSTGERRIIGIGREVEGLRKDGSSFPMHLTVGEFKLYGRRVFVGICYDISERHRLTRRIARLSTYDDLTGCVNRHHFVQMLEKTLDDCRQSGVGLGLLFIDLDGFKQINDNYGHVVGDRLLKMVARRFRESLRDTDTLGRVGGDEFVVSMTLADGSSQVGNVARRLVGSLAEPFVIDGALLSVSASVGISLFPEHGQSADELVNAADIAMYRSKSGNGPSIQVFSQAMREESERIYQLARCLREAIEFEQFELHYQLQVDLETSAPAGLEALLRWRDDSGSLVPPDQFIPVAAKYGLMPAITAWVLRRACADNVRLIEAGLLRMPVAVNVCVDSFAAEEFVAQVERILDGTGLPRGLLELEITEDVAMNHSEQVLKNSRALREAQVQLAMDDFGTGYSSLGRLKSLHFNKLKIDRSFVAGLPGNESDREIVRAILSIARALGLGTVAEGIESEAQRDFLRAEGCDLGQGYWFARPMPLEELIERLGGPAMPPVA